MEVIKIENLSKIYKLYPNLSDRVKEAIHPLRKKFHTNFYALNDLSFSVKQGETVGILGKNGSGKSTLLKILTGVLTPTSGKVEVKGKIAALLELGAGFNPDYTGLENIYLNGTLMGLSKLDIDKKVPDILSFADIGDFIFQPVKTYSSGMFARLAFAVSINVEPDLLIIDEALSVGDVFFQQKCFEKIKQLKKQGVTILFVSHDVTSISTLCDRCVLINEGNLISQGQPRIVINDYIRINTSTESTIHIQKKPISNVNEDTIEVSGIEEYRYGDKTAVISEVQFSSGNNVDWIVYTLEEFTIKVQVDFIKPCESPVVAFYIKNKRGVEMYSGNTFYLNSNIGAMKQGDNLVINFNQIMYLAPDEYTISIGLSDFINGSSRPLDRRYDIQKLTVKSTRQVIGLVDLDSKVEMYKGDLNENSANRNF